MEETRTIYPELHKDIKHLTHEEVEQMQKDYLSGELKVKQIMEKYNITGFPYSTFYKRVPPIIDRSIICPECNVYSVREVKGWSTPVGQAYCPSCGQILMSSFDPQKRFFELRRIEMMAKQNPSRVIKSEIPFIHKFITREEFDQLSFDQKVFFGSWVMSCIDENLSTIDGTDVMAKKICPSKEYFDTFMDSLVQSGFFPTGELWRLRLEMDSDMVRGILSPSERFGSSTGQQLTLWREIAFQEILELYDFKMKEVNFPVLIGEKATLVIYSLINTYSVAQSWNLVYYSVKDGCEFFTKNLGDRRHAANTVLYNCSRRLDKYSQNNWSVKPFQRWNKFCEQSEMSIYFFEKVLQIGDLGFTLRPSMKVIDPLCSIEEDVPNEDFLPTFD